MLYTGDDGNPIFLNARVNHYDDHQAGGGGGGGGGAGGSHPRPGIELLSLTQKGRRKLESYQHLFYLLQTEPRYLAQLLFLQVPSPFSFTRFYRMLCRATRCCWNFPFFHHVLVIRSCFIGVDGFI